MNDKGCTLRCICRKCVDYYHAEKECRTLCAIMCGDGDGAYPVRCTKFWQVGQSQETRAKGR